MSTTINVSAIEAFNDNYIWLISNQTTGQCIVVDPGDSRPVLDYLHQQQLSLCAIFITHHHHDHVGGVDALQRQLGDIPVYGPALEAQEVVTIPLTEGDKVSLDGLGEYKILDIPGHTLGHIAFANDDMLFCGDTLFSAGCGRMFEGQPAQFQPSLAKLAALPAHTKVYCAHEYTLANLAFAQAVTPHCTKVLKRLEQVTNLRLRGQPSIPTSLAIERDSNPFLRLHDPVVQQACAQFANAEPVTDPVENFARLRRWKDDF